MITAGKIIPSIHTLAQILYIHTPKALTVAQKPYIHTGKTYTQAYIQKMAQSTGNMNRNEKKVIEFYYDIFSPYTWFAFEVLMRYKAHWSMDLKLKPFLLAAVTKKTGNSAPMLVPNKALYMAKDLLRCAKYFNVPLNLMEDPAELILVKGSLTPNRFLVAISLLYPSYLESASRAVWMEVWNKDHDITDTEVLRRAGLEAGLNEEEVNKVIEHITHQDTKDTLRKYTDEAFNYNAFGSPTIIAHLPNQEPMLFFGSDRFPVLAQEIGEPWYGPQPNISNPKL